MDIINSFCSEKIEDRKKDILYRYLYNSVRSKDCVISVDGNDYISFACNDYFGLSQNEGVIRSAEDALYKYGAGSGASRLITGNNELYKKLEENLASFREYESSLVFSSGYSASIGVIPALMERDDIIIADKYVHASLIDASILSRASFKRFAHNNVDECRELVERYRPSYKKMAIIVENVYSMHGDVAPIAEIYDIAVKNDAFLIVDDAHGVGTVPLARQPHVLIGTMSKALGSVGGYVCSSRAVIDYFVNFSRSVIYSTGLPPASIAAAIESIKILSNMKDSPLRKAELFCKFAGLPKPETNIIILPVKDNIHGEEVRKYLKNRGFIVSFIRKPTVPSPIIRISISLMHKEDHLRSLGMLLQELNLVG